MTALNFIVFNSCGGFGIITESNVDNAKTLTVNTKKEICNNILLVLDVNATCNFTIISTGIYTIKFAQPDASCLSNTLNIQCFKYLKTFFDCRPNYFRFSKK